MIMMKNIWKSNLIQMAILSLTKIIVIPIVTIVIRAVVHENSKHYPKNFLDECLYKI